MKCGSCQRRNWWWTRRCGRCGVPLGERALLQAVSAAKALIEQGRYEDAESTLRPIAEREPPHARGCVAMIDLLLKTKRSGEIPPFAERAARAEVTDADECFAKAAVLSTAFGDWERAAACVDKGLRERPTAWGFVRKAEALIHLLNPDGAIAAYREGLAIEPGNTRVRSELEGAEAYKTATALFQARQFTEAVGAYAAAAVPLHQNARVLFDYGEALLMASRAGEALPILNRAFTLTRASSLKDHLAKVGCLIELRLIEEAQAAVRELIRRRPDVASLDYAKRVLSGPAFPFKGRRLATYWHAQAILAIKDRQFLVAQEYMHRALYIRPGELAYLATMAQAMVLAGAEAGSLKMSEDGLALPRRTFTSRASSLS